MSPASPTPFPATDPATATRAFRRTFLATAAVKLLLAGLVPFTTDEAYFVLWGRHLDYGYYDHGAMTGWWLWLMLGVSDAAWWLRLPAIVTSQFAGWALWRMLRPLDPARAGWAAALYLVSPINVLNVLITTDTPLLFFSVVSVLFAVRGVQAGRWRDYFFAGLALGLAFLSKYFAVLLGVSYAVLLLTCVGRPRWRELLVLLSGIIPGVGINVAWNYHHGWTNVLFNLITRQESSGFSLLPPLLFIVVLLAVAGPGVIAALLRRTATDRRPWREAWHAMRRDGTMVFTVVFGFPLAAFFVVAFANDIGVHWVLSFFPWLAAVLFSLFGAAGLRRMTRTTALYSAVPVLLLLAAPLVLPLWAKSHRSAFSLILAAHPDAVLAELEPYRSRYLLATPSYAKSALLGYLERSNVPVIGYGSFHGRQDDLLTDLRTLDGRDLMIVTSRKRDAEQARPWFNQFEVKEHTVDGALFYVLLGDGFRFADYRAEVLQEVADRYYPMPAWLQPFSAPSPFLERYDLTPRPTAQP